MVKSKQLLKRYAKGGHRKNLFTNEKIFTIEQHLNKQNDRIYDQSSKEASQLVDSATWVLSDFSDGLVG